MTRTGSPHSRMGRRQRFYRIVGIVVVVVLLLSTVGVGLGQLLFG